MASSVFLSDAVSAERLPFAATPAPDSPARRRWRALSGLYRDSLTLCGLTVTPVLRPEIYETEMAREACGVAPGDWHLAVKPLEHLRPFHGIPNAFVCDWPHPVLSARGAPGNPFLDHLRLLGHAQVVACTTARITEALHAAGLRHAVTLPPYLPTRPRDAVRRAPDAPATFLAVADSGELHRSTPLLQGFAAAQAREPALRLLLALDPPDPAADLPAFLAALGLPPGTATALSGPASSFHAGADFFLWAGSPAGLPLPPAQAALAGLPLVTVPLPEPPADATVPVAVRPMLLDEAEEPAAAVMPLSRDEGTPEGVCDAVLRAAALPRDARTDMARAARTVLERRFGLHAFRTGLRDALALFPA